VAVRQPTGGAPGAAGPPGRGAMTAATRGSAVGFSSRLEWDAFPRGVWGLAAVALAALAVWAVVALYRREGASRRAGLRWPCAAARLGCMAALAVVIMRPSIVREAERFVPGRVVVLADRSASMSVRDAALPADEAAAWARALGLADPAAVADLTRHEIVRAVLDRREGELLRALARRGAVDLRTFAGTARRVLHLAHGDDRAPVAVPEWSADGTATDLAAALLDALEPAGEGALAGVLVLSDGRDTTASDVADALVRGRVPVHFVGVGAAAAPPNVAVLGLDASDHAMLGLPMRMTASVGADGYAGRSVSLVLSVAGGDGAPVREVLRREVVLPADGARVTVDLTHVPEEGGRLRYRAHVEPLPGEARTEDNAVRRDVLVSARTIAVLLAAGGPSTEFRFLRSMLQRDPLFTVRAWTPEAGGPPDPSALADCDVVVLCDPPPDRAAGAWSAALAERVDAEGLGLAFVAGPRWTPEVLGGRDAEALADLLPVVADSARLRPLVGRAEPHTVPCPVEPDEAGARHPILAVSDNASAFWAAAPPVYWVLPVARAKPGATVLLRVREAGASQSQPLAAVQPYGLGRVFYCGTPETWRWRRMGIEEYDRFWLQAVRYCAAARLEGVGRGARILLERNAYAEGEAVHVRLRRPPGGSEEGVEIRVESEAAAPTAPALHMREGGEGLWEAVFHPPGAGRYELVFVDGDGGRTSEVVTVGRPDVEFQDLRADRAAMRRIAADSGGQCFGPEELDRIPEAIPDAGRVRIDSTPPDPLWDAPAVLIALVGALAVEWLLRKRMGLL